MRIHSMKNKLIITGIIIAVISVGLLIAWEAFSYKTVRFELKNTDYTLDIVNKEDKKVSEVSDTGEIKLKEGEYRYKVIGDRYSNTGVDFTVKDNTTVIKVNPAYSTKYLEELLTAEHSSIEAVLSDKYAGTINYTIRSLNLYQRGEWAAGTLTLATNPRQLPDTYRFVLQKVNKSWILIVPPQIAISKAEYKNVPNSVLDSLYSED